MILSFIQHLLLNFETATRLYVHPVYYKEYMWPYMRKGIYKNYGGSFGVVANELDCDIVLNKFKFQLHNYIHFLTNNLLERSKPPYSSKLWVKYYHYSLSTSWKLMCH